MKLNDLVQHIPHTGASDAEISAITYDSRKAAAGSLFVCLVGAWLDGHTYAASAYKNGCRAFLCEHALDLPADAAQIITADTRAALAVIGADFYGNPADQLHIIGITGTKGKTTTALLTAAIMTEAGLPCAYIGSNGVDIAGVHEATANTTPESLELHRLFRKMLDANVHHVVLEVSSQALRHNRVDGIPFEVVAFTNLSEDHIGPGEHPDFEDYKNAKHRLFVDYQAREMIYNADDDTSEFMRIGFGGHQTSYGIERAADYHGTALAQFRSETALGIDFLCEHGGSSTAVRVLSPGEFSASDALCAIALCGAFGVSPAQAAQTLAHTPVETTLLEPIAQFTNGDLLNMSAEEWRKQINYLRVLLELIAKKSDDSASGVAMFAQNEAATPETATPETATYAAPTTPANRSEALALVNAAVVAANEHAADAVAVYKARTEQPVTLTEEQTNELADAIKLHGPIG